MNDDRRKAKREKAEGFRALGVVFLVAAAVGLVLGGYSAGRTVYEKVQAGNIDGWVTRAKDAGNPQQTAEFLREYTQAVLRHPNSDGYTCIWRYPNCNVPRYLRAVEGLIVRAEDLSRQAATDLSYQQGLLNLEKDLGDLEAVGFGLWWGGGGWRTAAVNMPFGLLFGIIFLIVAAVSYSHAHDLVDEP